MPKEIPLGSKVRDIYSGLVGIAVHRVEFINGCIQYGVLPPVRKDNKPQDEIGIDSGSLEIIAPPKKPKVPKKKKPVQKRIRRGGPSTHGIRMRGF